MDKLDRLVWATTTTFKVGDYHIGVRSNTEHTGAFLRRAFSHLIDDTVKAPPNYSVILTPSSDNGRATRNFQLLYENHTALVRTQHPSRVLTALRSYLSRYLIRPEWLNESLIEVESIALVRQGRAILAPSITRTWIDLLSPRLHRSGFQFADSLHTTVDTTTGELVVEEPVLQVGETIDLEDFEYSRSREPGPVVPGRYPIAGWAFYTTQGDDRGRLSAGAGVFSAVRSVTRTADTMDQEAVVASLADLFRRIPAVAIRSPYEGDLATNLAAVASADSG